MREPVRIAILMGGDGGQCCSGEADAVQTRTVGFGAQLGDPAREGGNVGKGSDEGTLKDPDS